MFNKFIDYKRRTFTLDRKSSINHELIVKGLEAKEWLEEITGLTMEDDLEVALQDGVVLCKAIKALRPDLIKVVHEHEKLRYKKIENIEAFIGACKAMGVKDVNLFDPIDLYEKKNVARVILCIHSLAAIVEREGIDGAPEWVDQKNAESNEEPKRGDNVRLEEDPDASEQEEDSEGEIDSTEDTMGHNKTVQASNGFVLHEDDENNEPEKNEETEPDKKDEEEPKKPEEIQEDSKKEDHPSELPKEDFVAQQEVQEANEPESVKNEQPEVTVVTEKVPEAPQEEEELVHQIRSEEAPHNEKTMEKSESAELSDKELRKKEKRARREKKEKKRQLRAEREEKLHLDAEKQHNLEKLEPEPVLENSNELVELPSSPNSAQKPTDSKTSKKSKKPKRKSSRGSLADISDSDHSEAEVKPRAKNYQDFSSSTSKNRTAELPKDSKLSDSDSDLSEEEDPERIMELEDAIDNLLDLLDDQKQLKRDIEERISVLKQDIKKMKETLKPSTPAYPSSPQSSSSSRKDTAPLASDIIKQGFLEKKGGGRRNWLKRNFVLSKDHILRYYANVGDKTPKGSINLVDATVFYNVAREGKIQELYFIVRTESRDYLIRANDKKEKDIWVKAIANECVRLRPDKAKAGNTYQGRKL